MEKLIDLIKQFESKESKLYWIKKLHVSNTIKGKLIYYFNV